MALSDRADHFDRGQGARFTTFVYKRLWGVMMDWFDQYLSVKLRQDDIDAPTPDKYTDDRDPAAADDRDRAAFLGGRVDTVRDGIVDGGSLTFDEAVERIGAGEGLKMAADAAHLNPRDRMILNKRAKGKKLVQIAQEQGIDPAHIYGQQDDKKIAEGLLGFQLSGR
jgi:hypothetical protein